MNSIKKQMWTDLTITSAFGMPICGRTRVVITRDQAVAGVKGHVGVAPLAAYVPGTSAWSPPTC